MRKLFMGTVMVLAVTADINANADGIKFVDQKNALSDVNNRANTDLEAYSAIFALESHNGYVDGVAFTIQPSFYKIPECDYVVHLGQDNSIKVSAQAECTNQVLRKAAPPYKPGELYMQNDVVSSVDSQKGTIGIYKCFQPARCGVNSYGPGQEYGETAWALLSRTYIPPKKNHAYREEDVASVKFNDYKHAFYIKENQDGATSLPLEAILTARKTDKGNISFYVDNSLVTLPRKSESGSECSYIVNLQKDNAIQVSSNACFKGYARKPSEPYKPGFAYKRGDIVVENKMSHPDYYSYYQCMVPCLCGQEGYGPTEKNGYRAWVLTFINMFP